MWEKSEEIKRNKRVEFGEADLKNVWAVYKYYREIKTKITFARLINLFQTIKKCLIQTSLCGKYSKVQTNKNGSIFFDLSHIFGKEKENFGQKILSKILHISWSFVSFVILAHLLFSKKKEIF